MKTCKECGHKTFESAQELAELAKNYPDSGMSPTVQALNELLLDICTGTQGWRQQ